jgi:hypothetical protein
LVLPSSSVFELLVKNQRTRSAASDLSYLICYYCEGEMSGSGYSSDEDDGGHSGLSLSAETMAALKDFAVASGIPVLGDCLPLIAPHDLTAHILESPKWPYLVVCSDS